VQRFIRYLVNTEKKQNKISDDAENNSAVTTADSNNDVNDDDVYLLCEQVPDHRQAGSRYRSDRWPVRFRSTPPCVVRNH